MGSIEYNDELLLLLLLPPRRMAQIKYKQGVILKRKIEGTNQDKNEKQKKEVKVVTYSYGNSIA